MREIKYRAWIKKEKRMEKVDFINFAAQFAGKWECRKHEVGLFSKYDVATKKGRLYLLKDIVLLQDTGLKDKNNKEICEGNIVRFFKDEILCVKWIKDEACFYALSKYGIENKIMVGAKINKTSVKNMEVIGNIYENPELLEETKND